MCTYTQSILLFLLTLYWLVDINIKLLHFCSAHMNFDLFHKEPVMCFDHHKNIICIEILNADIIYSLFPADG